MGFVNAIYAMLHAGFGFQIAVVLAVIISLQLFQFVYNVTLHPLAKFPGPKLWSASRVPFVIQLLRGRLVDDQRRFHDMYGPIVRIAPDEISFADEAAWKDIYAWRKGHKRTLRDPAFYIEPEGQADNIVTSNDPKFHAKARGLLSPSFSEAALQAQNPTIEKYSDLFIHQIYRRANDAALRGEGAGGLIDITDWFNFLFFDVIGDLALGESFSCLTTGRYHPWVNTLVKYMKAMTIAMAPRYWPTLQFVFEKMIPSRIKEGMRTHQRYAEEKIYRRLDSKTDRPDFFTPVMKADPAFEKLSREELASSFMFVIIAAVETSAAILAGILNYMCAPENRRMLDRLTREIRARYAREEDITVGTATGGGIRYLDAVVQEGMRMCHPIPLGTPRQVPVGGDIYAGVYLPGGTRLRQSIIGVTRSKAYFARPDTFAPERWLPKDERPAEFANDRLAASKPFLLGFHLCLGWRLADAEMRLVLSRLLWAFDLAAEPGANIPYDAFPKLMLVQKQSVMLRARARAGVCYKGVSEAQAAEVQAGQL